MRDIDFEELDKAVGSYLENGVVPSSQEKNNEVFSKIENQIEHSREQQRIVFARKAPQSASQLHQNNEKKQIRNIKKVSEKQKNEKKVISGKPKVRILDDFSAPVPPEHHRENFGVPFLVKEDKIAFESPILETYGGEKLVRSAKKLENSPIRKKILPKNDKKMVEVAEVKKEIPEIKSDLKVEEKPVVSSRADFYAGVYRIGEDENKLRVFHGERAVEVPKRQSMISNFADLPVEDPEKVMPEISSSKSISSKVIEPIHSIEEIQKEEPKNPEIEQEDSKIEVKMRSKTQSVEVGEPKTEKKINIVEVEEEKSVKEEKSDESTEKVIIQSIDEAEKPKTPFVQNPQIEKRPLGINQSQDQSKSFEFRSPNALNVQKVVQKPAITKELRRAKMSAPILSSDEYSTPVKHRKRSGWGVVLAIFAILLLGAGAGFVAYLVAFQ